MKLKNLFGASLMTLSLMLSVTPQTVLADDETTDVFVTSVETAAATLTEEQYKIYSVAKQQIAEIAAGKRDYAVVEVNIRDTFGQETLDKYNYTLSELDLTESNFDSNGIGDIDADTAFQYKWEEEAGFNYYSNGGSYRINHAVFLSLGYEVYWHDRAGQGYAAWPVRVVLKTLEDGSKVVGMDETSYIPLTFGVSKKYQGNGDKDTFLEQWYRSKGYEVPNFTVNTSLTASTSAQVLKVARKVVSDNAGKSDLEKLYAYKDWICDNVDYDTEMAVHLKEEKYDLGDSSQATNVFDENASTKVVCEGYAKAFKLLCDLSDFQDETLKCNFVMGPASGSAGGASYGENHMWNIVTVNGKNYIADVTNTDEGSVGEAGVYFMVGGNKISSWSGFGYSMSGSYISSNGGEGGTASRVNHSMTYKYDEDTQDAYGTAALTIDANSPVVYTTVEEAGKYVAEQMKARTKEIAVSCAGVSSSVDLRTAVLNAAFKHTGEAGYGDNLKRQIDSYLPATSNNTVMYDCTYFDSANDVARFEKRAEEVLAGMKLDGKTDYEKIETIYDWITRNIDYMPDYASAGAPRHTASGALLGWSAVCEGYANLAYYFLLKAGIDNRIVVSADHAWNIVKLNGIYYNIDTTWDATFGHKFFLKTDDYYTDMSVYEYNDHHIRLAGDDCSTAEFYAEYPMTRYNYGEEPEMTEAKVTVSFNDEQNSSVRPETVTVTLNDGKYDYPVKLTAAENWSASVNVPKEGTYTGTAAAVTGYTASEVSGDLTNGFTAEYVLNHYTVTWKNEDGTVLETDTDVAHGLTPEYNGETPVKADSSSVRYIFNGWKPEIQPATADVTYTASFQSKYKTYLSRYSCDITIAENSYVYDGTEKTPEVTVKYDSYPAKDLAEGVDYILAYENNVNAGTATVSVTGIGDYYGTVTATFTIEKAEQKLSVSPAEVTLKVGETAELTVEADDEVTYTSADETVATVENGIITAVGAGEVTVKVTVAEKENYKAAIAEVKVIVEVDPVDISTLTIRFADENVVYDGTEKKPEVIVEDGSKVLTEGTDYTVTYENNINAGTATAAVAGTGNYYGTVTKTFEIAKADQKLVVTPTEVTLKVGETAELTVEADNEVSYTSADETVATVADGKITAVTEGDTVITVAIEETDNYKAAATEVKVTVEAAPADISGFTMKLAEETVVYDGTEKKPAVIVGNDDIVLTEGTDYTVAYENNINAGTAKVIVTGIGSYTSVLTKTFEIVKAEQKLTVTPAEVTLKVGETAELAVEADAEAVFASADEAVATVDNGIITAVGAGETTITVSLAETENYKAATAEVKVTVEAAAADISVFTLKLAEETVVYDGTEKKPAVTVGNGDIVLIEGTDYTVAYENNINAGTATVTVTGIGSYSGVITKTFEIAKADQKLVVTPTEVALKVGETAVLTVEADAEAVFASADEAVATVENGTITAVGAGETTITVSLAETENYKAATAEVKVTVEAIPPTELEVLAEEITNSENLEEVVTFEETAEEVKEKIEEAKTNGETLTVDLEKEQLAIVPETDETLVVGTVKPDEETQIEYFDINLLLKAGNNEEPIAKIVETKEPITVTLPLSEDAKGADGYKVIRVHAGVAEELPCTVSEDGNSIIFTTDRFSTYAVVYRQEKAGIEIYGSSLALEGKVRVNFYLDINEIAAEDLTIHMTMNNKESVIAGDKGTAREIDGHTYMMYEYPVAAKEMRDIVTLTVVDDKGNNVKLTKDGIDYTEGYPYSASEYFARAEEVGSEKTKKLNRVLNNYGKYAQIYFDYKVTDEVKDTVSVADVTAETLESYKAVMTEETVDGLTYAGGSTMLDDAIGFRIYFNLEEGHQIEEYTFTIDGNEATPVLRSGAQYYVELADIAAKDLGVMHTIKATDGTKTFGIQYSALSYARRVLELTGEDRVPLQNMCRAMYLYNQQAIEYFNTK